MLNQRLEQKLLQKLSPQQILLMKLLQIPTAAMDERIKQEIEENPALEDISESEDYLEPEDNSYESSEEKPEEKYDENFDIKDFLDEDDIPEYKLHANNYGADDDRKEWIIASDKTFSEFLTDQINEQNFNEKQRIIADHLIGMLDDSGYLGRDIPSIADDMLFLMNIEVSAFEIEAVLKVIQDFDPAGIGARNLRECLLIQIRRTENRNKYTALAEDIINTQFAEFTKKHYDKIQKKLNIDKNTLSKALDEIVRLNPKPGNALSEALKSSQAIIPDFIITNNDGYVDMQINSKNAYDLRLSGAYSDMFESISNKQNKTSEHQRTLQFIKQKVDSARWFIDAIQQRQNTMYVTMKAIMEYQKSFFIDGDETHLKPMILKDIAEKVGLDISTISRVVNSKYVQTPFGTFLLKTFFSESLSTDSGEEVSTREVKKILLDCIAVEEKSKPLTDDEIAEFLNNKGYNIARRTVAKYREQLEIPVARLRKEINT